MSSTIDFKLADMVDVKLFISYSSDSISTKQILMFESDCLFTQAISYAGICF